MVANRSPRRSTWRRAVVRDPIDEPAFRGVKPRTEPRPSRIRLLPARPPLFFDQQLDRRRAVPILLAGQSQTEVERRRFNCLKHGDALTLVYMSAPDLSIATTQTG